MNDVDVLYKKDGFTFLKNCKNNYSLKFKMDNKLISLSKIIDFNLIKMIYDLNGDIYENVNLEILNEKQCVATLLMKHLFEDIGLPQRYSYLHMIKIVEENMITFTGHSIYYKRPEGIPVNAEQMPIKNIICTFNIITSHSIEFCCDIKFDDHMNVPQFAEKMVGLILFKIFNRVKQFIENVRI